MRYPSFFWKSHTFAASMPWMLSSYVTIIAASFGRRMDSEFTHAQFLSIFFLFSRQCVFLCIIMIVKKIFFFSQASSRSSLWQGNEVRGVPNTHDHFRRRRGTFSSRTVLCHKKELELFFCQQSKNQVKAAGIYFGETKYCDFNAAASWGVAIFSIILFSAIKILMDLSLSH